MQLFRKKYIYNPENPIYESQKVRTFNCMNTETKENKLIIIHHLKQPPFIDPSPYVLQPIENPTVSEPFSVYPLVYCCSEIGKVNETDAMFVLKCLLQSKMKKPIYCVLAPQGICCSEAEGLLPNRSPSIFEIAIDMMDIPANLAEDEHLTVSRKALDICRGIRDGDPVLTTINSYGWTVPKKEKDIQKDNQFWIFKGKRKYQGPFNDEYSLSWESKFGLSRFHYIDLSKDGYQEEFYDSFMRKIDFYRKNESKDANTIEIFKYSKQIKGIKIFTEILNHGTLSEYINRRQQLGRPFNKQNAIPILQNFVNTMRVLRSEKDVDVQSYGSMHIRNLYVHNHRIVIGEPLLVTDKMEKKIRQLKNIFDYYAPQMKENIILPENLFKLDFEKMDIWSFGFILHKILTGELPGFDSSRHPILIKQNLSPKLQEFIERCLSLTPAKRPFWDQVNIKELTKNVVVVEEIHELPIEREEIRLGTKKEKSSEIRSEKSNRKLVQDDQIIMIENTKPLVKKQEQQEEVEINPIPIQLSSRLKKIKLVAKIIIIMLLYIFVFFRPFLGNSISILLVRSFYGTTSLNLVNSQGNVVSTSVIITHDANFFLLNDISFSDIQDQYNCINDQFDPIYNPDYSLLTYVQSPSFLALLLTGWATIIFICVTKCLSIWKGGISNRPNKSSIKYWVIYGFHQLSLASLLFAHFFIYQFFYFAWGTPCFSIESFAGVQPFFDSSLYLFLTNISGYLQQIFPVVGILAILVLISSCYYAWGPKLDQKYFLSIPSILFRIVPYVLLILMCRIGVFLLFAPTALNDPSQILPAIVQGSAQGFFGVIPEIFILITIATEVLLELFFHWCQKKASQSDKLSKLFNIKQKKRVDQDESRQNLNDMSIHKNSKISINEDEVFN